MQRAESSRLDDAREQWRERVVLVTGAAGGLGRALVRGFLERGARVVLTDVDEPGLKEALAETGAAEERAVCLPADISRVGAIGRLVAAIDQAFGRLDVLVNNAAILCRMPLGEVTEAHYDEVMNVNLRGMFFLSQEVVPLMLRHKWGRIVNVASIGARTGGSREASADPSRRPRVESAVYAASKAAMLSFTKAFARSYAADGILCNAIAPALIPTPMMAHATPEQRERLASEAPIGRWADRDHRGCLVAGQRSGLLRRRRHPGRQRRLADALAAGVRRRRVPSPGVIGAAIPGLSGEGINSHRCRVATATD